jgi:hypothetical protein
LSWAKLSDDALAAHVEFLIDHQGLDFHSDEDVQTKTVLQHPFRSVLAADLLHALDSAEQAAARQVDAERCGALPSASKAQKLLANKHLDALYDRQRIEALALAQRNKRQSDMVVEVLDAEVREPIQSTAGALLGLIMCALLSLCSLQSSTTSECALGARRRDPVKPIVSAPSGRRRSTSHKRSSPRRPRCWGLQWPRSRRLRSWPRRLDLHRFNAVSLPNFLDWLPLQRALPTAVPVQRWTRLGRSSHAHSLKSSCRSTDSAGVCSPPSRR